MKLEVINATTHQKRVVHFRDLSDREKEVITTPYLRTIACVINHKMFSPEINIYLSLPMKYRNALFQHELGHVHQANFAPRKNAIRREIDADKHAAFNTSYKETLQMLKHIRYCLKTQMKDMPDQDMYRTHIRILNIRIRLARKLYNSNSPFNRIAKR